MDMLRRIFAFFKLFKMAWAIGCAVGLFGCRPGLFVPDELKGGTASGEGEESGFSLELEPAAPPGEAPSIVRLKLWLSPQIDKNSIDIGRIALFEGELGSGHLRQIEQNKISKTLAKRIVPSLVFEQNDENDSTILVLAPTVVLERGEVYTFASGSPFFSAPIRIVDEDAVPALARIWPPEGKASSISYGLWCGTDVLPPASWASELQPMALPANLSVGAVEDAGMRCVRAELQTPLGYMEGDDREWVGPPALALSNGLIRLDPRPWKMEQPVQSAMPLECETNEIEFGPGCARVMDDRLLLRSPDEDLLWVISSPTIGLDEVRAAAPKESMVIAGLPSQSELEIRVSVINTEGNRTDTVIWVKTLEPMPHVILNEVYANPVGMEPDQEWVELFNDGRAPARLDGYTIVDIGGESVLPEAELLPGEFALVVNESFWEDGELDPLPAPNTPLIRVPRLGKGGLSNSGEPLKLLDKEGAVISRFAAAPRVKAGQSLSRRFPTSADGVASSFLAAEPTPGQANAASLQSF